MYCGSNSEKAFNELCMNLNSNKTKREDNRENTASKRATQKKNEESNTALNEINGTVTTKKTKKNDEDENDIHLVDVNKGGNNDFVYAALHPHATKKQEFYIEYPIPPDPSPLAYCFQTFNYQLTNFTISICYVENGPAGDTKCLPSEDMREVNQMVKAIDGPVGLDSQMVKVIWTDVEVSTRMLVGVVGKEEDVKRLFNF